MNTLGLSPIPSTRIEEDSSSLRMEREGFVDEAVVAAMVSGPRSSRSAPCPGDLALAVDDMDFAGWQLSPEPITRGPEVPPQVIDAIVRRATPPTLRKPGTVSPRRESHRWWLAGLAGVFCSILVALLLMSLSSRPSASRPSTSVEPAAVQATAAEPASANLANSSPTRH